MYIEALNYIQFADSTTDINFSYSYSLLTSQQSLLQLLTITNFIKIIKLL